MGSFAVVSALLPDVLTSCTSEKGAIQLKTLGANFKRGHLLWSGNKQNLSIKSSKKVHTVIVGGGMSGLVAAYQLKQANFTDFVLLELAEEVGGNSGSTTTPYSKAPLGAHYLSLPNSDNTEMIAFLQHIGLITGQENGKWVYNDRHLCHAPNERLYYRGQFQEGLVPSYGISSETSAEIERFFHEMRELKKALSSKGIQAYNIPLDHADYTEHLVELDKITFETYLKRAGYSKEELLWFLDYCCRDDFGAGYDRVSAWSGINYFAGRKADPANAESTSVLTWPQGNFYLAEQLQKNYPEHIQRNKLVIEVKENGDQVSIRYLDCNTEEIHEIIAEQCIVSSPSYVCKHILDSPHWPKSFFEGFQHYPWLIGIVTLSKLPSTNGLQMAWDNVKFGTKGLGYISNRNQELGRTDGAQVLSVYLTLDKDHPDKERRRLYGMSEEEMKNLILEELKSIHPDIEEDVMSISFQRWGHGMITPVPGTLQLRENYDELKEKAQRVHLAHTDFSGYSVFEEAFQAGTVAAKKCLKHA